jgi:hypothetical protein
MCQELLKVADQTLDQAREGNAAKTSLKILDNMRDKLLCIAQSMKEGTSDRSEEKLINMTDDVLYKKGCS